MTTNSNSDARTIMVALGGDWQGCYGIAQNRFASTNLVPIRRAKSDV
jgi:hypothetical protein